MENVLITMTLEERMATGTLELIKVTFEGRTEYDVVFVMLDRSYNVARIQTKRSAQKFYRKQMKRLIEKGVLNYFYDLENRMI